MTDNEIIKALKCCVKAQTLGDCRELKCPASTLYGCQFYLRTDNDCENAMYNEIMKDALDLINRQKAEIKRLEELVYSADNEAANVRDLYKEEIVRFKKHIVFEIESAYDRGRKAAIKEFAERLKEQYPWKGDYLYSTKRTIENVDNLVKEMVGEDAVDEATVYKEWERANVGEE